MEQSLEPREEVRRILAVAMKAEDADAYSDQEYAAYAVNQNSVSREGLLAMSAWLFVLYDSEDGKRLANECVTSLEAIYSSTEGLSDSSKTNNASVALSVHASVALASAMLLIGQEQKSCQLIEPEVSDQLEYLEDSVDLQDRPDLFVASVLGGFAAMRGHLREDQLKEAFISLIRIYAYCEIPFALRVFQEVVHVFDAFCTDDKKEPETWLVIKSCAEKMLTVAGPNRETDCSNQSPAECSAASASYWAWQLGRVIGLTFVSLGRDVSSVQDALLSLSVTPDLLVMALLSEMGSDRDWRDVREHYSAIWQDLHPTDPWLVEQLSLCGSSDVKQTYVEHLGPNVDLYWAVKLGFAGAMVTAEGGPKAAPDTMERISNIATRISLTQMRHSRELASLTAEIQRLDRILGERLPKSPQEAQALIEDGLGDLWGKLPAPVKEELEQGVIFYYGRVHNREATIRFATAVEVLLQHCFVEPLKRYMLRHRISEIKLPGWRTEVPLYELSGRTTMWSKVLRACARSHGKKQPDVTPFDDFLTTVLKVTPEYTLQGLAHGLGSVAEYRGGASHLGEYEAKKMRRLVLGEDTHSVLAMIWHLFTPAAV